MKRTKKIALRRETVRALTSDLERVVGGEQPNPSGGSQCWCPSVGVTLCPACPITVTDGCP